MHFIMVYIILYIYLTKNKKEWMVITIFQVNTIQYFTNYLLLKAWKIAISIFSFHESCTDSVEASSGSAGGSGSVP